MKNMLWIGAAVVAGLSQTGNAQIIIAGPTTFVGATGGNVVFNVGGAKASANFRAQRLVASARPTGVFNYQERGPGGNIRFFTLNVDGLAFQGNTAALTGRVMVSNVAAWQGKRMVVNVVDGGLFFGFDFITFRATAVPVQPLALTRIPRTQRVYPLTRGNLVVRPRFPQPQPIPILVP